MTKLLSLFVAGCLLASASAGSVTQDGLNIETSDRWLDTVSHGGACMSVSCSYKVPDGSPAQVAGVKLMQYNPDSASYNILVESISIQQPNPQNAAIEFKATASISASKADLQVNVFGQKICQYAKFKCILELQPPAVGMPAPTPLLARSEDDLPFEKITSNQEWLRLVMDFIHDQVETINARMTSQLDTLDARVKALQSTFSANVQTLSDDLNTRVDAVDSELDRNARSINTAINTLTQQTDEQVKTLKSAVTSALSNLRDTVDTKISTVEGSLDTQLLDVNTQVTSQLAGLSKSTSSRLASVDAEATTLISGVKADALRVSAETQGNITALQDGVSASVADLTHDIEQRAQNAVEVNTNKTTNLGSVFGQALTDTDTALTADIANVDEGVKTTKTMLDTKLAEYQAARKSQTEQLKTQVKKGVEDLEKVVSTKVVDLAIGLDNQVTQLGEAVTTGAANLNQGLSDLEASTTAQVGKLQSDVSTKVTSLDQTVQTSLEKARSNIVSGVVQLDNAVVQVTKDLQSQLQQVSTSAAGSLTELKGTTVERISKLEKGVLGKLSDLQTGTLQTVDQLSSELVVISGRHDTAVRAKLTKLQNTIDTKIDQVSQLVAELVGKVGKEQGEAITALDGDLITRLTDLSASVKDLNNRTSGALDTSFNSISADIKGVESKISPMIAGVGQATTQTLSGVEKDATKTIVTVRDDVAAKIADAEKETAKQISGVLKQVQDQTSSIKTTNSETTTKLSDLENEVKNTQENNDAMDKSFDNTDVAYGHLDGKLNGVDLDFTSLSTSSAASFKDMAEKVDKITDDFSKQITGIGRNLDSLEKTRSRGQMDTDVQFTGVGNNLDTATQTLYTELEQNFDVLDQLILVSDETLRNYLKPEKCEEGMGFTASASLQYVVIAKSQTQQYEFLCDAHTDHGGWIVIQRRMSGDTDFYQDWQAYKNGFGSVTEDFWLGLERVYQLTSKNDYELRIDMTYQGSQKFAQYSRFSIGDESTNYAMTLGDYFGTAGDSMFDTNTLGFSTYDADNDRNRYGNCAKSMVGGWWYNNCQYANLNGVWGQRDERGPRWNSFTGTMPVVTSEMKIRLRKPGTKRR